MTSNLAAFSGTSSKIQQVAKALSSGPALSLLCSVTGNFTKIHANNNALFVGSCTKNQQERHYTTDLPSITCKDLNKKPHQDFSFGVAKHMLQEKTPEENLLCSPLSTNALLNMLVPGSKDETLDQFLALLALKREEKVDKCASRLLDVLRPFKGGNGPKITVANGVWIDKQYPLTQSYEGLLRSVHKADVKAVDFQYKADEVVEEVNQWAKDKTKGMIKSILSESSYYNDTVMVLANTLSLKFDGSDETFDPTAEQHSLYYSGTFEGCEVLRMPYKDAGNLTARDDRRFSMYIFVSPEKHGILKFLKDMKLDAKTFKKQFTTENEEISEAYAPKFNIENEVSLTSTMKQLGMTLPFKAAQSELMRFVDSPLADMLYVTDVIQKSRIETNEGGTRFAVSTYTTLCGPAHRPRASPSKLKFVADNPFVFMIREDSSGAVVSVGTMLSSSLSS